MAERGPWLWNWRHFDFNGAVLRDVGFHESSFMNFVSFEDVRFEGNCRFDNVRFGDGVSFAGCSVDGLLDIKTQVHAPADLIIDNVKVAEFSRLRLMLKSIASDVRVLARFITVRGAFELDVGWSDRDQGNVDLAGLKLLDAGEVEIRPLAEKEGLTYLPTVIITGFPPGSETAFHMDPRLKSSNDADLTAEDPAGNEDT